MNRQEILSIMNEVMKKRGRESISSELMTTREANFRSLDFSETALRIEMHCGAELVFDAASMRKIETVGDVVDFFESATQAV